MDTHLNVHPWVTLALPVTTISRLVCLSSKIEIAKTWPMYLLIALSKGRHHDKATKIGVPKKQSAKSRLNKYLETACAV